MGSHSPADRIRLEVHSADDVVEVHFDGAVLSSTEEAEAWTRALDAQLERLGDKVWLLVDLGGFTVRPAASAAFGRLRAAVLEQRTHASARYGGDPWTQVAITTSAQVHQTHGNVFATRAEALAWLKAMRRDASAPL